MPIGMDDWYITLHMVITTWYTYPFVKVDLLGGGSVRSMTYLSDAWINHDIWLHP